MPNRKTFDPQERYDHSGRPVGHAQRNDLKPDISEEGAERGPRSPGEAGTGSTEERRDKPARREKSPAGS